MPEHLCWSTGTSSSTPSSSSASSRPSWSETFPRGQGGGCGQGAFDRTCLKAGIQQTQFVSCCVISSHTHTHRGKKGKEKKRQEHLASWRGSGFAECRERTIFPKGGEGRAGWLPHTCLVGPGSSTHGWQHRHQLEPFGEKQLVF